MKDSTIINEVMVLEGFAYEYACDSAYEYQGMFVADERAADAASAGLWSPDTCDGYTERPAT